MWSAEENILMIMCVPKCVTACASVHRSQFISCPTHHLYHFIIIIILSSSSSLRWWSVSGTVHEAQTSDSPAVRVPWSSNSSSTSFPKRLEFSFSTVAAFPNSSSKGLTCAFTRPINDKTAARWQTSFVFFPHFTFLCCRFVFFSFPFVLSVFLSYQLIQSFVHLSVCSL